MLSDEEKKAMEHLRNYPINWLFENVNESAIQIVLNLIEKQSKEIEELKEDNTELKRTYLRTAKHQENIGHIELAHYMLAQIQAVPTFTTWEDYKTWVDKDKIKAKIEEIKEERRHYLEINDEYNAQICDCIIEEYKSLLEKE